MILSAWNFYSTFLCWFRTHLPHFHSRKKRQNLLVQVPRKKNVDAGKNSDFHFWCTSADYVLSKERKDMAFEVWKGRRGNHFLAEREFPFSYILINKAFPFFYLQLACTQISFPPKRGYKVEKRLLELIYLVPMLLTSRWKYLLRIRTS